MSAARWCEKPSRTLTGKGCVESRAKSGTRVRPREEWNQLDVERAALAPRAHRCRQLPSPRSSRCATPMEPTAAALAATARRMRIVRSCARLGGLWCRPATNAAFVQRRHRLSQAALYRQPQRVLLADRPDVRGDVARELPPGRPGDHRRAAFEEHRAVMEAIEAATPNAPARRPGPARQCVR